MIDLENLSFKHILIGLGAAAALMDGGGAMDGLNQASTRNDLRNEARQILADEALKEEIRLDKALLDSEKALNRVKAGCVKIVDIESQRNASIVEGEKVTADKDHIDRLLPAGTFVCNSLFETAVIDSEGRATDILRVAPADQKEYIQYFRGEFN